MSSVTSTDIVSIRDCILGMPNSNFGRVGDYGYAGKHYKSLNFFPLA